MGIIHQFCWVNTVWKIWGRTSVLQPIMLPLGFLLSTWSIPKWVVTLLMTSMCSLPSLALGAFSVAPSTTEHELRTHALSPPHLFCCVIAGSCHSSWRKVFPLHIAENPASFPVVILLCLPLCLSVGDFLPWVKPAPYFSKPRLETTVASSMTTDSSNHLVWGNARCMVGRTMVNWWMHAHLKEEVLFLSRWFTSLGYKSPDL